MNPFTLIRTFLNSFNNTIIIGEGCVIEGGIEQSKGKTIIKTKDKSKTLNIKSCGGLYISDETIYKNFVILQNGLKIEVPRSESFQLDGDDENIVLTYKNNKMHFSSNSIQNGSITIDGVKFSK